MELTTVKVGDRVFWDTWSGPVECTVKGYTPEGEVELEVKDGIGPYRRGETFEERPLRVVPRKHLVVRHGQYRIIGAWRFEGLPEEHQPQWHMENEEK